MKCDVLASSLHKYLRENHSEVWGKQKRFSNHPKPLWTKIDVKQSTSNLLDVIDSFEEVGIKYTLVFGSLLGIYRDGSLIDYDTDTDLAIWLEDEDKVIKAIKLLKEKNLLVTRFDTKIISFTRGGDYIDIYLYRESESGILSCVEQFGTLSVSDFSKNNVIKFQDRNLVCVHNPEEYFKLLYGRNWRTPIKNKHANIKRNRNRNRNRKK